MGGMRAGLGQTWEPPFLEAIARALGFGDNPIRTPEQIYSSCERAADAQERIANALERIASIIEYKSL